MLKSLVFCLAMVVAPLHDFHVSITRIDYNEESKKMEITLRVFTDDMATGLDEFTGQNLNFEPQWSHRTSMRNCQSI